MFAFKQGSRLRPNCILWLFLQLLVLSYTFVEKWGGKQSAHVAFCVWERRRVQEWSQSSALIVVSHCHHVSRVTAQSTMAKRKTDAFSILTFTTSAAGRPDHVGNMHVCCQSRHRQFKPDVKHKIRWDRYFNEIASAPPTAFCWLDASI